MTPTRSRGVPARAPRSGAPADPVVPVGRAGAVALALVWTAPVLVLPGLAQRWGWPTLVAGVLAIGFALWAAPAGRLPRWFVAGLGAGAALCVLAAVLSADPLGGLFGRAPRYEGLVAVPVLAGAVWLGAHLLGPRAASDAHRVTVIALSAASLALGGVALLEAVGLRPLDTDLARPGALAGNATDQGILGVVFAGVLAHALLGTWRRTRRIAWWPVAGVAAAVVSIVTSASRAALLAAALAAIVLAVRAVAGARHRVSAGITVAGIALVTLGIVLALPAGRRILAADALAAQTIGDRLVLWRDALQLIAAHPWTGVGPSGYRDAVPSVFADAWHRTVPVDHVLDSPHNVVLQLAVVGGIPLALLGVALALAVLVVGVRAARTATTARRDLLLGALTVLPAAALALSTTATSPKTLLPLAVLAGALVARDAVRPLARAARWVLTGAVIAWGLVLAAWTAADAAVLGGMRAAAEGRIPAADASFSAAATLRAWDADIDLTAARAFGGALRAGAPGATDAAHAWAQRAATRLPASAEALEAAGTIALDRGDIDEALARLGAASRLAPANPRIAHEYGVAAYAAGDRDAAEAAFARAVALAPDSAVSRRALAEVRAG